MKKSFRRLLIWQIVIITTAIVMLSLLTAYVAYFWILKTTFKPLIVVFQMLPIAIGVCIVLAVTFHLMSRSLRQLMAAIDQVSQGDFSIQLDINRGGIFRDTYRSFNKMAAELRATQTLRDDFTNQFSHEFRTPITSIKGFAEVLQHQELSVQQRQEYLQVIVDESQRLSDLATSVMTLTSLENQEIVSGITKVDLSEQLRQNIILFLPKFEAKNIQLDIKIAEIQYESNVDLLTHIWQNLLNNAWKYTLTGGKVQIFAQQLTDGTVQVDFMNDGPLIKPDVLDNLFQKFYQEDETHSGLGLGLNIVKRSLSLIHGQINIISNETVGTVFTVTLPALVTA